MIDPGKFYAALQNSGADFFCGVPDSLLKDFCAFVTANTPHERNLITVNEGAAVALAAGYHIGTGRIPVVYMQNSGLGNAANPLLSLADADVYSIPMILIIGWRGEPGVKDEPQHKKQGRVTAEMLGAMGINWSVLDKESDYESEVKKAAEHCLGCKAPYAFLVRKDTFSAFSLPGDNSANLPSREKALETVLRCIPGNSIIVSTTGMLSRELFELREKNGESHDTDFLTVGSMGHTSQIAAGIAYAHAGRSVWCFEGDGGALMHLGSYAFLGAESLTNLRVVMFNNGSHDSVGGQPTIGFSTNFPGIFSSFGFSPSLRAENEMETVKGIERVAASQGPAFLELRVRKGARKDLGRPTRTPIETKESLMKLLGSK